MLSEKPCHSIQIITPKKYLLDGLWFGGNRPWRTIIFVHGLASSVFAHHDYLTPLAGKDTAVLFFNNRGHDKVSGIKQLDKKSSKGFRRHLGGGAEELFTESADDIAGTVAYCRKMKAKEIYLVGHSTGCQKTVYYLSRKNNQRKISGAMLLCPVSDYAHTKKYIKPSVLKRAEEIARKLVKQGKPHEFLPLRIWPDLLDAQRFLSLNTPNSVEEIFTYSQPKKTPNTLRGVKVPLLIVLAGHDEYHDRDAKDIRRWFEKNVRSKESSVVIIPHATHSFRGKEQKVVNTIQTWLKVA